MEISFTTWLLLAIALILGLIAGFLIARLTGRSEASRDKHQLKELQKRFDDYQEKVTAHFASTANLMKKLNQSYQDVRVHMADGAQRLAEDDISQQRLMSSLLPDEMEVEIPERLPPLSQEAPKDYAPKEVEDPGVLDETYGLKNKY